ncbi:hypothetical protein ABFV99_13280 [Cytobacillus horneckiae]|uniref:hypothetical protein n=1 Tax=Cytobacillus horneckiae TaxID=549687 RepID=UPI0034CF7D3F
MNIEKAKNDIVYFAENVLGYKLQNWQRDVLKKYDDGEIIFFGDHRNGKNIVINTIKEHQNFIS